MSTDRLSAWLFHQICAREDASSPGQGGGLPADPHAQASDRTSSKRFFSRFSGALNVNGKSVLDVGCGGGPTCVEAALRGATRVVGVDIRQTMIDEARAALVFAHPELTSRIRFVRTDGSLLELGAERFDVVLSKDSFEHYAEPERSLATVTAFLESGGVIAIGFAPLWKSPFGGHIGYMTRLPWAHLLFPEHVIMAERRRFRPLEGATRFEDVSGGLNKMTLARFLAIVRASGHEVMYFATNVSDHPAVRLMKAASRLRPLREYMTTSAYAILQPVSQRLPSTDADSSYELVVRN